MLVMQSDKNSRSLQVLDMENRVPQTCSDLAPPYPINHRFGGGGLLEDTPVICGGHSYNKECYKYDKARTS